MRSHVRVASVLVAVVASIAGVAMPAGAADKAGQVTEFSAGLSPVVLAGNQYGPDLAGISAGPDGNVWFTERLGVRLGRITPDGVITELAGGFPAAVVDGAPTDAGPTGITTGPDGNLWFGDETGPRIGRSTPDGAITEFTDGVTALTYYNAVEITAGPDGNLWFTQGVPRDSATGQGGVGRITPDGAITEFTDGITAYANPFDIAAGADGNLWFTETRSVGRITPDGTVTEFSKGITGENLLDITAGPDGNLWFTFEDGIGRITPKGKVTEFSSGISATPDGITTGCDGNLWFGVTGGIGRITPKGKVTTFTAGVTGAPSAITTGPDGNVWYLAADDNGFGHIGRVETGPPTRVRGKRARNLPKACTPAERTS